MLARPGEDEEDPFVGEVVDGRYRVTQRLGAGGMGFVYLAEHTQLGHSVVLKRLRPELVANESSRERFLREAQAASRIQHPNVIAVSDFGFHPAQGAYYVMELLVGVDLGAVLTEPGALGVERSLAIVAQAAEALAAAHAASIVHRDLKPENIFLTTRDTHPDFVKVLDFGLARVMDANRKLTETGQVIGTPRYMAPEQCRGEKVDARADVYSLALILHEMLTGQQPFRGLGTYEILGKKMFEHVEAPSELPDPVHLPAPLEAFLMRCLSREAPLRPADGARMADELHAVRLALGLQPSPFAHLAEGARKSVPALPPAVPSARGAMPGAAPRPGRSVGIALLAAMLVASGGIVGGGAWLFLRADPEARAPERAPATTVTATPRAAEAPRPRPDPIVQIVSDPPDAEVFHEGALIGRTPLDVAVPRDIPDGEHVEIRLDGYVVRRIAIFHGVPVAHVALHRDEEGGAPPPEE